MQTLRNGRKFFSMREGLHSHCLRLRILPGKFVLEAGRRSRTLCHKGATNRSVKSPRAVPRAVSQTK